MKILKRVEVPTGDILVVQGYSGPLELVSLGDYGKDINLSEKEVPAGLEIMSLEEKWVITISTQYGCAMNCSFCDVPMVGPGYNATFEDLNEQVAVGLSLHPEVKTKRLNVHFARMGEPTWNFNVISCAEQMYWDYKDKHDVVHPVVSTMMPKHNMRLRDFIRGWMWTKNFLYKGEAGLQLSINSTNEAERTRMFNGHAETLEGIARIMKGYKPVGRKITLNFAIADWEIDPWILLKYFDPEDYICKLTPMHKTITAEEQGIKTPGEYTTPYPYGRTAEALRREGYEVLVFIASPEEDNSKITCGNAILAEGLV